MGLFDKIKGPVFLKESSTMDEQIMQLKILAEDAPSDVAKKIEQEIKQINAGNYGENAIVFELKNSHMPMMILRDLYLEHNGLTAQIDFLIITRKRNFVIECKNLYGNIEINNRGDFLRINAKGKKEGIYSPITQNQRHLELIKQIRLEEKTNIITRTLFEKNFNDNYRSIVVLANTKTVINDKYAKKEIKERVIRADQLIAYIQKVNGEAGAVATDEKDMENLAQFFLSKHKPKAIDYSTKYTSPEELPKVIVEPKTIETQVEAPKVESETIKCPKCGAEMIRRKATKGQNAGKEFYGCTNFPKCRGIVNI